MVCIIPYILRNDGSGPCFTITIIKHLLCAMDGASLFYRTALYFTKENIGMRESDSPHGESVVVWSLIQVHRNNPGFN